jgi:hypothetical protein
VNQVGLVEQLGFSGVKERGGAKEGRRWMISWTSFRERDIVERLGSYQRLCDVREDVYQATDKEVMMTISNATSFSWTPEGR